MSGEVLIPFAIFGGFALIIKIIADAIIRNRLINRGLADEKLKGIFSKEAHLQRLSSLKWGMVLVGIGLALLINQITGEYLSDESVFGVMLIFAGIAFLVYYGIARKHFNGSHNSN